MLPVPYLHTPGIHLFVYSRLHIANTCSTAWFVFLSVGAHKPEYELVFLEAAHNQWGMECSRVRNPASSPVSWNTSTAGSHGSCQTGQHILIGPFLPCLALPGLLPHSKAHTRESGSSSWFLWKLKSNIWINKCIGQWLSNLSTQIKAFHKSFRPIVQDIRTCHFRKNDLP